MFGTTLTDEYRRAAAELGLAREQLAGLAANGVRASFLDAGTKQALLAEIDAVAAGAGDAPAVPAADAPAVPAAQLSQGRVLPG
jgi:aminodeoxyfutalosine deaminase